ncbi:MAG: hypothetical protein LBN21_01900 [Treponema sp.]|jgi:hypothetical protein|nr:hypothetical protein [Treponema sp.]
MSKGIGNLIWQISVALYLLANGVLGLQKNGGDFKIIYSSIFKGDVSIFVVITAIIALVAGVALLLELFEIKLSFLDTLILIVAIVWVVYIVFEIISAISGNGYTGITGRGLSFAKNFWYTIQLLAVHLIVLSSLLTASKKFG